MAVHSKVRVGWTAPTKPAACVGLNNSYEPAQFVGLLLLRRVTCLTNVLNEVSGGYEVRGMNWRKVFKACDALVLFAFFVEVKSSNNHTHVWAVTIFSSGRDTRAGDVRRARCLASIASSLTCNPLWVIAVSIYSFSYGLTVLSCPPNVCMCVCVSSVSNGM